MSSKLALLCLLTETSPRGGQFDLIDEANELLFALSAPPAAGDFAFSLQAFRAHCRGRFRAEENALIEAQHRDLLDHASDHRRLERHLDDIFQIVIEHEPSADEMRELVTDLRSLLTAHILRHDLAIRAEAPSPTDAARQN